MGTQTADGDSGAQPHALLQKVGRGDDLDLVEKQIVDNCCSAEAMAKRFERKADVYPLNLFPENAQKFADLAREDPEELSDILQVNAPGPGGHGGSDGDGGGGTRESGVAATFLPPLPPLARVNR